MQHSLSRYLIITVAAFLLWLYSHWLLSQLHDMNHFPILDKHFPDAFAEQVVAINMDENGQPKNKLIAPKVLHYQLNDSSLLYEPLFIVYSDKRAPLRTSSHWGNAEQGVDKVVLWDNVIIHQFPGQQNDAMRMRTSRLTVLPKSDYAETQQRVYFQTKAGQMTAVGMKAYLKQKKVRLLADTRGVYDAQQANPIKTQ